MVCFSNDLLGLGLLLGSAFLWFGLRFRCGSLGDLLLALLSDLLDLLFASTSLDQSFDLLV